MRPSLPLLFLTAFSVAANSAVPGEALFQKRCSICHGATPEAAIGVGPNLYGVVGRKPGSTPYAYSAALKRLDVPWTAVRLEKFLSGPAQMVPGTKMPISIGDRTQRQQIIEYLGTLRR